MKNNNKKRWLLRKTWFLYSLFRFTFFSLIPPPLHIHTPWHGPHTDRPRLFCGLNIEAHQKSRVTWPAETSANIGSVAAVPARSWPTAAGYLLTLVSANSGQVIDIPALQYGLQLKLLYLARASHDKLYSSQENCFTRGDLKCKSKGQRAVVWMRRGDLDFGGHPLWSPLLGVNTDGHSLAQRQGAILKH